MRIVHYYKKRKAAGELVKTGIMMQIREREKKGNEAKQFELTCITH